MPYKQLIYLPTNNGRQHKRFSRHGDRNPAVDKSFEVVSSIGLQDIIFYDVISNKERMKDLNNTSLQALCVVYRLHEICSV